jgi:hypothetical protein
MYARLVEKIARVAELPYHSSDSALDHKKKAKKHHRATAPMPRCQETSWQNPMYVCKRLVEKIARVAELPAGPQL